MADKEIREYHTTSGDNGMSGAMIGVLALVAVLFVGAMFYLFAVDRPATTASGPAIERTTPAPATTGQGQRAPAPERAPAPAPK